MLTNTSLSVLILFGSVLSISSQLPSLAESSEVNSNCKSNTSVIIPAPIASKKSKAAPRKLLSGIASWYGAPFHGRRTASGQIFDMNKLTAAHPTLPLSSRVLVENPQNGKVVVIEVNDRGPYIKNRVIDLSREAARQLGILSSGIAYVNYSILPPQDETVSNSITGSDD